MKENKNYSIPKKYIDIGLIAIFMLEITSLIYESIQLYLGKDTEMAFFTIMCDSLFLITITIYKIVRICKKKKQKEEESLTK